MFFKLCFGYERNMNSIIKRFLFLSQQLFKCKKLQILEIILSYAYEYMFHIFFFIFQTKSMLKPNKKSKVEIFSSLENEIRFPQHFEMLE